MVFGSFNLPPEVLVLVHVGVNAMYLWLLLLTPENLHKKERKKKGNNVWNI